MKESSSCTCKVFSTIILHFSLETALEEKMRESGSPEELLQGVKKGKVCTIRYLKLPEPEI